MSRDKITPEQALQWCQKFLGDAWSTVTVKEMSMKQVSGGLSNFLYSCFLSDHVQLCGIEPRKVLLRIYGEVHQKQCATLLIDSVVSTLLSEKNLGPRVHGIFPEGRLEEFVEAESLHVSEIRDAKTSRNLGQLLGKIHQLNMPLIKEPIWLFRTIERYLADLPTDIDQFESEKNRKVYQELRSVCNFTEEFEQLKKILTSIHSPVRFAHNDFQPANILRLKSESKKYTVIDFEYCSYNYRGFDIGNHFCEFMFDYTSSKQWPFFKVDFNLYPNKKQQINFLLSYIDTIIANRDKSIFCINKECSNSHNNEKIPFIDDANRKQFIDQLMREANYFSLASHFFWTLWAINMAKSTTITFGYMEYARTRLTAYYLTHYMLMDANEMPPHFTEDILRSENNPFRHVIQK